MGAADGFLAPYSPHLKEMRKRFILSAVFVLVGFCLSFVYFEDLVTILKTPFTQSNLIIEGDDQLYINSIFEGFFVKIKVSFISGLIITLPIHIFEITGFIMPALTKSEKKGVLFVLVSSSLLIPVGLYYGYNLVIPLSIQFLTGAGFVPSDVGILLNYNDSIVYIFQFLLAFAVVFELPIALLMFMKLGIVERQTLQKYAKHCIVVIFILSAIITPPDVVSQCLVALPLIALFYLAILIAKLFKLGGT